jgi:hypothetical protein
MRDDSQNAVSEDGQLPGQSDGLPTAHDRGAGSLAVSSEGAMAAAGRDGSHDFDFWMGRWHIRNRRLRERLAGCTVWDEFEATGMTRPLAAGIGNEDEFHTDFAGGFVGMTFRFYNRMTRQWALYWADSRNGVLEPPVLGSFTGETGTFTGTDTFQGRPIQVRFIWSRTATRTPRWEQAFSGDGGNTWETNWIMDMSRPEASTEGTAGSAQAAGTLPEPQAAGTLREAQAAGAESETRETRADDEARATGGPESRVSHLAPFEVVELRRYTTTPGGRERFARYFESYFPEAFEQLGSIFFGHFFERDRPDGFTMLRGFKDNDARAIVCSAFYHGPLWREHSATMNDLLIDNDDVLLLRPLSATHGIPVLPAVDMVREAGDAWESRNPPGTPDAPGPRGLGGTRGLREAHGARGARGARGAVVAQIFPALPDRVEELARQAEAAFSAYRAAGAREAGVLVTLDVPNNFPRLPIRTDGPFLVWLGVLEDRRHLEAVFEPLAHRFGAALQDSGLLRGAAEFVVLDPAARSRLRWLPAAR